MSETEVTKIMRQHAPIVLLAASLVLAGCVSTTRVVSNPYGNPPPVRSEAIPKPPVSEQPLIWQPGHWDWSGDGYVWREGRWVPREGHGTEWQDGYWTNANGSWTWLPAHWL
jgi:WXXGXW repeat (2 copies)